MINNLNEALVSMGYRKLEPNKPFWLKPFCFSVIAVRVENNHVIMRLLYNYNNKTEICLTTVVGMVGIEPTCTNYPFYNV